MNAQMQRYHGSLLGLAVGDALGTTLEFKPPGTFPPLTDMVGGGPFHLQPGGWTDDTSIPVPLAYAHSPAEAIARSGESPRTTHGAIAAVDACRYLGGLIVGALQGTAKKDLLADRYSPIPGYWDAHPLAPEIADVAAGSFKRRHPPEIRGTGYVVQALEAALWAFHRSESFRDGCLLAVNLGDDADTTGAVYGQLAGAFYGEDGIPETWHATVAHHGLIEAFADRLWRLSGMR
jgi:ADP-ribosyl-[dinitrogen reductase] hydrolase